MDGKKIYRDFIKRGRGCLHFRKWFHKQSFIWRRKASLTNISDIFNHHHHHEIWPNVRQIVRTNIAISWDLLAAIEAAIKLRNDQRAREWRSTMIMMLIMCCRIYTGKAINTVSNQFPIVLQKFLDLIFLVQDIVEHLGSWHQVEWDGQAPFPDSLCATCPNSGPPTPPS